MNDHTPALTLPYLTAAQAQKHVTVNEAFARLDGLVACRVQSRTISAPPAAPAEGDGYIAPAGGLPGAWGPASGGDLMRWIDGAWSIQPSPVGLLALVADEDRLCARDAAGWRLVGELVGGAPSLDRLGVGTTADAANPLSAKLNALLFTAKTTAEGGDGDLRFKLNKATAADVLSLLFQTGYSARAEIGLVGDDRLKLRVSADGAAFTDAVTVESDGRIGLGADAGAARLAVGGVPPIPGALSVIGSAGGISLAVSDSINSSLYVRNLPGGATIGTDGGGALHLATGGHDAAARRLSLDAIADIGKSAMVLWIDTGAGLSARRVSVGAPDSAGAGFRLLRVPN